MKMKNRKLSYLILSILLLSFASGYAQDDWIVPDNEKGRLSKFEFDDQAREAGENLYMFNCRSCHGIPGQGNYLATLDPAPGDPATDKIQHNSDGELYYKLKTGKGQMPSFRNVLSPNQIWQVIAYLRSFNDSYVQQIAEVIEGMELKWEDIEILLSLAGDRGIEAKVSGLEAAGPSPVPNVDIQLFAIRRFGNLLLEEQVTDEKGIAFFSKPEDLPGDPEGKIEVLARLTDEETYGTVSKDTIMEVGMPFTPVSLTKDRALWNNVRKAPVWVLVTYIGGVLLVWGFIFLVMVDLRSIFKIGQYFEKQDNEQ